MKPKILIVEDEPAIRDNIQFVLQEEGLETFQVALGGAALAALAERQIDLILLDVGLPDISGFDLLKEIRKAHATPVILLTARNNELDRVLGLEIGADDYIVKPFSPRELSARVKAVLRRTRVIEATPGPLAPVAAVGPKTTSFAVNESKRQVTFFGEALALSKYEYDILVTFITRPGHVYSREQLMQLVWEQPETSLDRTVDVHIKNIRAKLRAIRPEIDPIVTHRGTGYSLREDL
ncbi:MAG TPA: two-component system response regulator CreB [Polyangiaceae bacterium]|nr:two-component system response regulator CreB [Polyangiaceae bacterium]